MQYNKYFVDYLKSIGLTIEQYDTMGEQKRDTVRKWYKQYLNTQPIEEDWYFSDLYKLSR